MGAWAAGLGAGLGGAGVGGWAGLGGWALGLEAGLAGWGLELGTGGLAAGLGWAGRGTEGQPETEIGLFENGKVVSRPKI